MSDPQIQSSRDATQQCRICKRRPTALGGRSILKCSRCRTAMYCSVECQGKDWIAHKLTCWDPAKPVILIMALAGFDYLLETVAAHLLAALRKCAYVVIAVTGEEAGLCLGASPSPRLSTLGGPVSGTALSAVILADGALTQEARYDKLRLKLVDYASGGGTVIFGATFASFIRPDKFDSFMWESWGLLWRFGDCYRTVVHLNKDNDSEIYKRFTEDTRLTASYSQKAVFLKFVLPEQKLYAPNEQSRTQSMFFIPRGVNHSWRTSVCWTKTVCQGGWLGYVGDVNCEKESTAIILSMCGLGLEV